MRGRKLHVDRVPFTKIATDKKESPNEGTETDSKTSFFAFLPVCNKKESPNEGTETEFLLADCFFHESYKKESPNEGTETALPIMVALPDTNKKESPNEGTETGVFIHR